MRFRTCPLHGARVHLPVSQKDTPDQASHTPPAPPGAVARWGSALQRVRECTGGPRVRARAAARRGKCRQPRQTRQSCRHPASRRGAMLWGIWRSAVHALGGSRIGWWFARACPAAREVFGTLPRVPDRARVPVCVPTPTRSPPPQASLSSHENRCAMQHPGREAHTGRGGAAKASSLPFSASCPGFLFCVIHVNKGRSLR